MNLGIRIEEMHDERRRETVVRVTLPSGRSELVPIRDHDHYPKLHRIQLAVADLLKAEELEREQYQRAEEMEL